MAIHFERSLDRSSHARLGRCRFGSRLDAGLIETSLRQDGPSDPRQLVGERNCQNIAMHAPRSRREPRSKTVPRPARRMEQNGTGTLDEERAQIAIPALGDAAKDGAIPVDICFGTRPSQAAKSRPLQKAVPLPIAATIALEMIGLALLYPALERSVCAPGHHGYPRASDLILRKALKGRWCHQITDATARPFLHLLNPTRRPRQVSFSFAWWWAPGISP